MSLALQTKLFAARTATIAAYDQAIASKAGRDVLGLIESAITRLNEADKLLKKAKK